MLKNVFWYFKKGLSSKQCDYIINQGSKNILKKGTVGNANIKLEVKKKTRDSDVCFLNDKKINSFISPFIETANKKAGWNFQYDWHESSQFTKYNKKQYYNWHQDSSGQPYSNDHGNYSNKVRKLSLSLWLNNPKDYEGGDLEFESYSNKPQLFQTKQLMKKGSIIVFPSFMLHRVTPVTKGTKYTLVNWTLGKPFE